MAKREFNDKIEAKDFEKMPQEYKDLFIKVMTIQADSELGGPHLYVEKWVLAAPTAEDQMMLAKTAAEEIDHHRKFVKILAELNVDVSYQLKNKSKDRILEIFREPLDTWGAMGCFGTFIDRVGGYHLEDFSECSYLPIARIIPQILKEERQHIAHGIQILTKLCQTPEGKAEAQKALDHMYPRALDMFGVTGSKRSDDFVRWGIKKRTNEEGRKQYIAEAQALIKQFGLTEPDQMKGRRFV
jgi:ring-1,2-phenylacetyl-CoA epoxidase subunit PaaA